MENVLDILSKYKTKGVRIGLDSGGVNLSIKGNVSDLDTSDKALLRDNKARLISFLSDQLSLEIPRTAIQQGDRLPLAPNQKGIWMHERIEGSDTMYLIPSVYDLQIQGLDRALLSRAAEVFVSEHEVLSFVFGEVKGVPYQELKNTAITKHLFFEDLSNSTDQKKALQDHINASMLTGFDLANQAPWSITVFDNGNDSYSFFVKVHHLIADGTTLNLIVEGLIESYTSLQVGETYSYTGVGYHDYLRWIGKKQAHKQSTKFWKSYLANRAEDFSFAHLPKTDDEAKVPTQSLVIDHMLTKQIDQFTKAHNIAVTHLFTFAFGLVLSKYGRTEDLIIGTPAEGRNQAGLNKVIGDLVNTVPVRLKLDNTLSITENLKSFGDGFLQVLNHQMYPFEYILDDLDYQREADRFPLFSTMVSFPNNQELGHRKQETLSVHRTQELYDLTLSVLQLEDCTELLMEFDTKKFTATLANNLLEQMQQVLTQILTNPNKRLTNVSLLSDQQFANKKQLIVRDSQQETALPTVLDAFKEQATKKGGQTAVIGNSIYTYAELNTLAGTIAGKLEDQGLKPHDRVLVALESNVELVASMLGIWMLGGVYVPVGTKLPKERVKEIEQDSGANITIDADFVAHIEHKAPIQYGNQPEDIAYILYTSGSTGKPKGVVISHKALLHKMQEEAVLLGLQEIRTLTLTSPTFDVSLLEVVLPLTQGGTIVIQEEQANDKVYQAIGQNRVNVLQGTPTYFSHFESELDDRNAKELNDSLALLCIGGESLNDALVQRLKKKLPSVRINNHYGPTEITIDALVKQNVETFSQNSIGNPIGNTEAYVVDDYGNLLPDFVVGELIIAGPSLAEGYWNLEQESKENFTFNDIVETRIYKTGDLATWLQNGEIQFIGRKDQQVKLRGFRIELEEINARLREIAEIEDAFTAVLKNVLVTWVVIEHLDSSEIEKTLSETLPSYMIPTVFQQLEALPMTTNGKVDEKQLPQPESLKVEYAAPRTELEAQLIAIWQEVLGVDKVGIYDNFFELGGHSLTYLKLYEHIKSAYSGEFPFSRLYELNTVESQSKLIEECQSNNLQIKSFETKKELPFYLKYYWQKAEKFSHAINISMAVLNNGENIDFNRLTMAFQQLCQKHNLLKSFVDVKEESAYFDQYESAIVIEKVQGLTQEEAISLCTKYHHTKFNFTEGPLIRGALFELSSKKQMVFFSVPHLIFDGQSQDIFWQDLFAIYSDNTLQFEPLKEQFVTSALRRDARSSYSRSATFWKKLKTGRGPINLFSETDSQNAKESIELSFDFEEEVVAQMSAFCKAENITPNTLFLVVISLITYTTSKKEEFTLCFDHHSREFDTMNQIGGWVQHLYLQIELGNLSFSEFVQKVSNRIKKSIANSDVDVLKVLYQKLGEDFESELKNLNRIRFNWYEELEKEVPEKESAFQHVNFERGTYLPLYLHFFIRRRRENILVTSIANGKYISRKDLAVLNEKFKRIMKAIVMDDSVKSKNVNYFLNV